MTLVLSGCSSIDNPFASSAPASVPGNVVGDASTTSSIIGAPDSQRIGKRGGTQAAVLVNGKPITRSQIQRRAAFLRLRRIGGGTAKARKELIDEALQMAEARRLNVVASQSEVNTAYARFAANNNMSPRQLDQVMANSGVTKRGFQDFVRAQISWQRAVAARARATGGGTQARNRGPSWLPAVGESADTVKQYTLQQVVFVVPNDKRSLVGARKAEANRFRSAYQGCEGAKAQASRLRDVSVLSRGRVVATELPPRWRRSVESTQPGSLTRPQVTEKGVEMLAVCEAKEIQGSSGDFLAEQSANDTSALEKKYMDELREVATIDIR